jgi:hypothetical protein
VAERADAIATGVAGSVDLAHATYAQRLEDLVGTEASAGSKSRGKAKL